MYNEIRFGNSFSYNQIASDPIDNGNIKTDDSGNIIIFNDGKKTPLVLGAIPRYQKHLEQLKKDFKLNPQDKINILTLNREFERNWAGFSAIIRSNKNLKNLQIPYY